MLSSDVRCLEPVMKHEARVFDILDLISGIRGHKYLGINEEDGIEHTKMFLETTVGFYIT